MSRLQYRTPDEEVLAEKRRVLELLRECVSGRADRPPLELLMQEACDHGLNWVEALEFAVACRHSPALVSDAAAGIPQEGQEPLQAHPSGDALAFSR